MRVHDGEGQAMHWQAFGLGFDRMHEHKLDWAQDI
jgi:hypothetical protein